MTSVEPNVFKLSNGLRVLHIPTTKFNSVIVLLMGKAGRRSETNDEVGTAHFFEHLLFDGTKKRPSAFEINKLIEEEGGVKNGLTSQESVQYFVRILPEKVSTAFDFLSDILFNSLLRDQDLEKERKVISQEAVMKKDDPDDLLQRIHLKSLYPNQNIGRNILDEWRVIDKISKRTLLKFMDRNYVTKNFVLTVVGNVSRDTVSKLANRYFSQMRPGNEVHFTKAILIPEKNIQIENLSLEQTKLALSFRGYSLKSGQMYVARMMAVILGAGFSSRIYDRLRTRSHLIYNIFVGNIDFTDTGYFSIKTKTSEDKLQVVIEQILEELQRIMKEPVDLWELNRAKNRLKSWFAFSLEDISFYAQHFSEQLLFENKVENIKLTLERIMKTDRGDIQEVAQYIFSDQPKISLLTPKLKSLQLPW